MQTYSITNGKIIYTIDFASLADAQSFADGLGVGYTVLLASTNEQTQELSNVEKVNQDTDFGISLIKLFRSDNAQYEQDNNVSITVTESLTLMGKFQSLIGLCQVGAIAEAYAILPSIEIDTIFTQERKDKYLTTMQNYLGI